MRCLVFLVGIHLVTQLAISSAGESQLFGFFPLYSFMCVSFYSTRLYCLMLLLERMMKIQDIHLFSCSLMNSCPRKERAFKTGNWNPCLGWCVRKCRDVAFLLFLFCQNRFFPFLHLLGGKEWQRVNCFRYSLSKSKLVSAHR